MLSLVLVVIPCLVIGVPVKVLQMLPLQLPCNLQQLAEPKVLRRASVTLRLLSPQTLVR